MIGRFAGSAIMKRIPVSSALTVWNVGLDLPDNSVVWNRSLASVALVLLGFFHSIMFPTIFALSLKHLGPHTKLGFLSFW